jgi:hypothetical protein
MDVFSSFLPAEANQANHRQANVVAGWKPKIEVNKERSAGQ